MAHDLLEDKKLDRRTLGYDMESFFAVIIWIASLDFLDDDAFLAKPLAKVLLDNTKSLKDVLAHKLTWFCLEDIFKEQIINHFQPLY